MPESLASLFDLLFPRTATVTWATAGHLPAGFQLAERFAALPAVAGRSFVVSLAARPGTASALTSYNALRTPRRRIVRRALGAGLRAGLVQPFLDAKIDIGTAAGPAGQQPAGELITEHLRRLLGRGQVVIAFGGGGGPFRKPVLQVFGADGVPLGYVKVGWNDWTREAIKREVAALRACAARPGQFGVPELLSYSEWRGLDLMITAPLPRGVRRLPVCARLPSAELLREISALSPASICELAASPWWSSLRARIRAGVADQEARARLLLVADGIERSHGQATLEFGTWHGDFVPWNLARLGGRLYAWDWESSTPQAPVGFDALHFHFQVAFVHRRNPLAESLALAARKAAPALNALAVPADRHGLLATLHLAELAVRHEEARSSAGAADGRFHPAALDRLEQELALRPGLAGLDTSGRAA